MSDPIRSAGPYVVTSGDPAGPKILVLDPAGAAKHDELPATWRPLAAHRQVIWCRLPVGGALTEADELLADTGPEDPGIDVVASGPFAVEALQLAERHPGAARRLLLVDPASNAFLAADQAANADEDWLAEHESVVSAVRDAGTQVRVIAHSTGGPDDQVPPPLPLGHPDVVGAIARVLADV
jgi:hypothetical protein